MKSFNNSLYQIRENMRHRSNPKYKFFQEDNSIKNLKDISFQ